MKSKIVRNFLICPFIIFNICTSTVEVFAVHPLLHESLEGPCHCPSSPFFLAVNLSEDDFLSSVQRFNQVTGLWLTTQCFSNYYLNPTPCISHGNLQKMQAMLSCILCLFLLDFPVCNHIFVKQISKLILLNWDLFLQICSI